MKTSRWLSVVFVLMIVASLLLIGCDLTTNTALEKKIEAANAQIALLQSKIESLEKDLTEQKEKREFDELMQSFGNSAYLTPGSGGYSPIKFDLGVLTVRLIDVKPYANGSKVTLQFGNTLSASIDGLKATIGWGKVTDKGVPINESEKSKEVTLTEKLRAGSRTSVSVVLDGLPPNELGFVRVRDVTHRGIELFGK